MKTTVEKFLLLVKNEHRSSSPCSYERQFRLSLFYSGGNNSIILSLHCKH
jgi:hypothetical protein